MADCECGCGQNSVREFLPGHDQKLRVALEGRVGGILHLRDLVDAADSFVRGELSSDELEHRLRAVFPDRTELEQLAQADEVQPRNTHAKRWLDTLRAEYEKETDRAAVIVAAAAFDSSLAALIGHFLVAVPSASDDLFDGPNAPLASFSAKIALAHRLGLISSRFARNLHLVRKIRNDFAHNISGASFEDASVRSRILELYKGQRYDDGWAVRSRMPDGPRGDFLSVCHWMLWALNSLEETVSALPEAKLEFGFRA